MPANRLLHQPMVNGSERRQTMLVPVAYSESVMPALRLARSSRIARRIAKWLFAGLLVTFALLAFAPWQQSVSGTGNVLAYSPEQRPQEIQATIKGRIHEWGENIYENAEVKEGQFIAEIHDLDEGYSARLELKLLNSQQAVAAARSQLEADVRSLAAAQATVEAFQPQVSAYQRVKDAVTEAQDAYVAQAESKVSAAAGKLAEDQAAIPQLEAELERMKKLQEEGNISLQKVQEVERKLTEARRKVDQSQDYVEAAKSELLGKIQDRLAYIQKAQVDIDYAQATVQKALGDVAKAESSIEKARQELNTKEKELLDMQTSVSRQDTQRIDAPFNGYLVQITPNIGTGILKEGDAICTIVPKTTDRSVQILLDGNDAPLVEPGRHVRLQFEGWPAVQFSGWPSVAVGTFGGEIVSVDATDNGKGKFRVLVRPDDEDRSWPEERFLRQGVRANGWVLLNQVPLWFEVWRQLNGFPPVVDVNQPDDKSGKSKPPKLPK